MLCEVGGRDWTDGSTSQGAPRVAASPCLAFQREAWNRLSLGASQKNQACWNLDLGACNILNCDKIHVLKHPICGSSLKQRPEKNYATSPFHTKGYSKDMVIATERRGCRESMIQKVSLWEWTGTGRWLSFSCPRKPPPSQAEEMEIPEKFLKPKGSGCHTCLKEGHCKPENNEEKHRSY